MKKPNYCKSVVIVHGKCELLLAEYVKSNLHLPIEIYAENKGKTSIQIDGLKNILGNNIFKNKRSVKKTYIVEEENGKFKNFSLIIMDLDDTSEENKKKYISGEMFENHWLSQYIIPIWNKENLDEVLLSLDKIDELPNDKEKGKVYRNLFPKNVGKSDRQQVEELMREFEKCNKTNMQLFLKICLDSMKIEGEE